MVTDMTPVYMPCVAALAEPKPKSGLSEKAAVGITGSPSDHAKANCWHKLPCESSLECTCSMECRMGTHPPLLFTAPLHRAGPVAGAGEVGKEAAVAKMAQTLTVRTMIW